MQAARISSTSRNVSNQQAKTLPSRAQSLSAQWGTFAEELDAVDVSKTPDKTPDKTQDTVERCDDNMVEFDETDFSIGIAFACTAQAPISGIGW